MGSPKNEGSIYFSNSAKIDFVSSSSKEAEDERCEEWIQQERLASGGE